jgi:hypothetical protein
MQHTLQFLAVSQQQVTAVLETLAKEGVEAIGDPMPLNGSLKGKTPLGEVAATYDFAPASGQLTVVVTEKPALLLVDTIKTKIREAIDGAAVPKAEPISETPVPAEIPVTEFQKIHDEAVVAASEPASRLSWKKLRRQTARAAHDASTETHG